MSRLKASFNCSIQEGFSNPYPMYKLTLNMLNRTDHIICETLKDNQMHSVFCKDIPVYIGHWFTFNKDIYTPKQSLRKATTYLKTQNFKRRLWK